MWIYKDKVIKSIEELPNWEALFGFIYIIRNNTTGKRYIGQKGFYSATKKHFGKKELSLITDKRFKTYTRGVKESNWKNYYGTINPKEDLVKDMAELGKENFTRTIIALARSKKELTFMELEHQIFNNVLRDDKFYNGNILGKFFARDLISN